MGIRRTIRAIRDAVGARVRLALFARQDGPGGWRRYKLIRRLKGMGYFERTRRLQRVNFAGRSVLDVGCGSGFYGPVLLFLGAREYAGCDFKLKMDEPTARNFNDWSMADMRISPRQLPDLFGGRLHYVAGGWEDLPQGKQYDVIIMYAVTEHLMQLEEAFETVADFLAPGGHFVYLHHNYASWNGHHQPPQRVDQIDPDDPAQQPFLDWAHLDFEPSPDHYVANHLNRIRLDDLRAVTERFFDIDEWKEIPSSARGGGGRLTPEISAKHTGYTERELTTQNVVCVASKKR